MSAWQRAWIAAVALSVTTSGARDASAYCRATTCDPKQTGGCPANQQGCETSGIPLFWASNCVSVSVQADAAPTQHIDYATPQGSVQRAFAARTDAECSGEAPSITVEPTDPVKCNESEYNSDRGN